MDSLKIKQIHIYNLPESHNIDVFYKKLTLGKNKYLNIIYIMDKIKENDKIKHLVKLAEISKGINNCQSSSNARYTRIEIGFRYHRK